MRVRHFIYELKYMGGEMIPSVAVSGQGEDGFDTDVLAFSHMRNLLDGDEYKDSSLFTMKVYRKYKEKD